MTIKKNLIISFFLLFIWTGQAMAKNQGDDSIIEKPSIVFRYNSMDGPSLNNFFIKEIARLNFLNLRRTAYNVEYDLKIDTQIEPGNKIAIQSELVGTKISGDVFFKDFDLSEVMAPTVYGFSLQVFYGQELLDEIRVDGLATEGTESLTIQLSTILPDGDLYFKIANLQFGYQEKDMFVFRDRISEINDYLALTLISTFQLDKADMIDPEDSTALPSAYLMIYDLERYLSIVSIELANIRFAIPSVHETFLESNLKKLNSHKRRLNTLFNQTLNSTVPDVDEQELVDAAEVLLGMQKAYLGEMNKQSFYYEPMYQYLAGYFYNDHSLAMLIEEMDLYFNFSGIIEDSSNTIGDAFKNILLKKYLLYSDSLIDQEKFQTAEIMLQSAATVCRSIQSAECDVVLFNKLSTTKWGVYDAYIRVAQSAMEAGNLDMGRNYLDIAMEFQMENKNLITTDGFTLAEYEKLAWEYFQQGNNYVKSERFGEALTSFVAAREIYRMLDVLKYDEVISKKIANTGLLIDQFSDVENVE